MVFMSSPLYRMLMKKHKLKSRLWGEISITLDMQMTPPLWQKVKIITEETKTTYIE